VSSLIGGSFVLFLYDAQPLTIRGLPIGEQSNSWA
jgi:hypothetical protein